MSTFVKSFRFMNICHEKKPQANPVLFTLCEIYIFDPNKSQVSEYYNVYLISLITT